MHLLGGDLVKRHFRILFWPAVVQLLVFINSGARWSWPWVLVFVYHSDYFFFFNFILFFYFFIFFLFFYLFILFMFSLWRVSWVGAYMRAGFLCVAVLRVAFGPRVRTPGCESALDPPPPSHLPPPVVCSAGCYKAVVPVWVLLFHALWFILRGDLF